MFCVYVLRNPESRIYIGQTENLGGRLVHHRNGDSRWTRSRGPWQLVHVEEFPTRSEAMIRERILKNGKANQELRALIRDSSVVERFFQPKDSSFSRRIEGSNPSSGANYSYRLAFTRTLV